MPLVLTNKETNMTKTNARTSGKSGAVAKSTTSAKAKAKQPTKADKIIKLLQARKGASVAEMQKATGWQAHSVRGFLSGTIRRRMRLPLQSSKDDKGIRRYSVQSHGETA